MKLVLSDYEQEVLSKIYSDIYECKNLTSYLVNFLDRSKILLDSEFHGLVLFKNNMVPNTSFISNNPKEFDNVYSEYLMHFDPVLDQMVETQHDICLFNHISNTNSKSEQFLSGCNSIRPTGDYYYTPIRYKNEFLGYLGHTIPVMNDRSVGERELNILNLVLPALKTGIQTQIMNEQLSMYNQKISNVEKHAFFFIFDNGFIEIPLSSNQDFIASSLNLSTLTDEAVLKHPRISSMLNKMESKSLIGPISENIKMIDRNVIIRMRKNTNNHSSNYFTVVTIESEKSTYNYKSVKTKFELTARERQVVESIMKGFSNKEISNQYFISEATVKKHISNIFEKTQCKNRTQLVFMISSSTE